MQIHIGTLPRQDSGSLPPSNMGQLFGSQDLYSAARLVPKASGLMSVSGSGNYTAMAGSLNNTFYEDLSAAAGTLQKTLPSLVAAAAEEPLYLCQLACLIKPKAKPLSGRL